MSLVKKIKAGDVMAFEVIMAKYEKKVRIFLSRWLNEEMDKDEVIQNSFFSFYKNINKVDEKKNISAYLYTIAKNEAIDLLRKQKRTLPLLDEFIGADEEEIVNRIHMSDQIKLLRKSIENLKISQRKVLKMYFFENKSYAVIQKSLGLPINTVKTLLRRAKINLSELMGHEKK